MAVTTNFDELVELVNDLVTADKLKLENAIYTRFFEVGDALAGHTVIPGVRQGNIIPIISNAPNYASFPYKDPSNCTLPTCDVDLPFEPMTWDIGTNACRIVICWNSFEENFLLFFGQYKRIFGDADLDTGLIAYITDIILKNMEAAKWRQAYFGDKSISNADPNYALLRSMNGIFTQAEAGDGTKIEIPENLAGTLTGDEVYAYLEQAYNIAAITPWFDPSQLVFEMTAAMGNIFVAWLNTKNDLSMYNCDCIDPAKVGAARTFSIDNLKVFGIPVLVKREFDGVINQLDLGFPYRALLTAKDNILFGTSEIDQLNQFRVWYSQDDNQIYIDAGFTLAPSLVTDDYVYLGAENGGS